MKYRLIIAPEADVSNQKSFFERKINSLMGAVGILLMLVASNVIPSADEKFHVPRWVVFVCGVLFALPGIASLFPRPNTARYLMAAILACFALVGVGCGLLGDFDGFSGGLPFLSPDTNILSGRVIFVVGGAIFFALSLATALGYGTVLGENKKQCGNDEDIEL